MKTNLFLKLEGKTNRKNKPKFLNATFLDRFCICSRKNGENGICAVIHPIYILLIPLMQKINKKLTFTWREIFTHAM